jgi:ATP/maltotriose-dependent transcriptional regulator MalT
VERLPPAFVGRGPELARLEAMLEGATGGRARVAQVVGEPGIGKTRLLSELGSRAEARRCLILSGQSAELEHQMPFGLWVDALEPYISSQNPRRFAKLRAEQLAELTVLFPGLAEISRSVPTIVQQERYRTFQAVRALIAELSSERPVLLTLDDVHWADQASLELLAYALRRPPGGRVLIAVAHRSEQAPELLWEPLARAERDGAAERIELSPLTRADAEGLFSPEVGRALRDELYHRSGGNPFYLEQLSRAAGDSGQVPRGVTEAISEELRRLSVTNRVVLQGAAVAGDPFSPEICAAAAGIEPAQTLDALDRLLSVDLLRSGSSPVEFRFRHPIVRAAVYEHASPAWRLSSHARAATKLGELGLPVTLRAHHIERSAQLGDREAVALLSEAGHAVAPRAPATAASWFAAALRLLPADAELGERLGLLAPLARSLGAAGQLEASSNALAEVLELLPPALGLLRSQTIAFLALVQRLLGRHGTARATLEAALHDLPDRRSPEAVSLEVELAADALLVGEWERAREWAQQALTLARDLDHPGVRAAAAALVALSAYQDGEVQEARGRAAEAAGIIDELGDDAVAGHLDVCFSVGAAEMLLEEYDRSGCHLERCIAVSRQTGQGHMLGPAMIDLGILRIWQGRLAEAAAVAEEALELAYLVHSQQLLEWAQTVACWVALKRGDLPAALAAGEEALRVGRGVHRGAFTIGAACWLAETTIESGDPAQARRLLLEAVEAAPLETADRGYRIVVHDLLARAEVALGELGAATRWTDEATAEAAALKLARPESLALRTRATVALAGGRAKEAAELALAAAERGAASQRIEAARARVLAGQALLASGDRERALAELRAAHRELDDCGALRYRDQAARELRRAGERIGRAGRRGIPGAGIDSLSEREREVDDLVVQRFTNREIAERLVLSEKTVERHLARIFGKLCVSSRVELARLMERARAPQR